jgi:hypothetical protein
MARSACARRFLGIASRSTGRGAEVYLQELIGPPSFLPDSLIARPDYDRQGFIVQ